MFSIIIPLYNKAPYVKKALESVYLQTFREFEVIVINDGSKDNSAEEVQAFHKENKYNNLQLVNQENQGVSSTRNNGVRLAKYPYVCFLDADDWWEDTFLTEMKKLIEEYPEAGIYGSSYFKVKDGHNIPANIGVESGFEKGLINYYKVYAQTLWMPLTSISVVIPKTVYHQVGGFKPELKLGEDFDLWIRIALQYSVAFLNKPLAYYNQDVEVKNRAIGKLYPPKTQFAFNTEYLLEAERDNIELKTIVDIIRITCLKSYYLDKQYRELAKQELAKVDIGQHMTKSYSKYLRQPIWVTKVIEKVYHLYNRIKR